MSAGWLLLAKTETVARNVTVVVPSDKTGRDILLAAIVTVLGSIAVGFIAAATAGKRQKRSIASAEREHTQRLHHERKQQDVQNLRGFFDEIAMDYEGAAAALTWFSAMWKPPVSSPEAIEKAREDAWTAKLKVPIACDRVALWFGDDHDVFRSYEKITNLIGERYTFLNGITGEFTSEQNSRSTELGGQILTAFKSFTAAARTEIAGAVEVAESEY